jgi:hypothetical protein
VKPTLQSVAAVEWQFVNRDRLVIRYEFASGRWSGEVEPYDDASGTFGAGPFANRHDPKLLQRRATRTTFST